VDRIKAFQADWTDFLLTRKPELLARVVEQKTITPELTGDLRTAADQFKQTWKP
jgi:hypothetical protein